MKNLISLLALFLISIGLFSQNDFRKASWGDSWQKVKISEAEVQWSEKEKANDGTYYYYFTTKVDGLDALAGYYFIDDKLVKGCYMFFNEHTNKNDYIEDYNQIVKIIEGKYGKVKVNKAWRNSLYKDNPEDWGFAISLGHYLLLYTKEAERSKIDHQLFGENYKISHYLQYKSKLHSKLIEETAKKYKISDF